MHLNFPSPYKKSCLQFTQLTFSDYCSDNLTSELRNKVEEHCVNCIYCWEELITWGKIFRGEVELTEDDRKFILLEMKLAKGNRQTKKIKPSLEQPLTKVKLLPNKPVNNIVKHALCPTCHQVDGFDFHSQICNRCTNNANTKTTPTASNDKFEGLPLIIIAITILVLATHFIAVSFLTFMTICCFIIFFIMCLPDLLFRDNP